MMMQRSEARGMPWVIVELQSRLFGLESSSVQEMVMLPEIAAVPGAPVYVRGVINLRGGVMPLVDLRSRLGLPSRGDETEALCQMLDCRAQDHQRWLDELERSVAEKREFKLARDPHKCAFGRWYDSFKTDNRLLSQFLKKFDAPHKRIHALADQIEEMLKQGRSDAVSATLEKARTGLLISMLRLFTECKEVLRTSCREIAVVLNDGEGRFAVSVDAVVAVEKLSGGEIETLAGKGMDLRGEMVTSVARRANAKDLVLVVRPESILDRSVLRELAAGELAA